jgi:hypothetical protein
MRAVLFEGTPEEFARAEAAFRAGSDPALQTRSIVLPQSRPMAWPELGEEHRHQFARRKATHFCVGPTDFCVGADASTTAHAACPRPGAANS